MVAAFKDFLHKFLEVYFDDWTIYGLIKHHIESLPMLLEGCKQFQISLNLKKCIFCAPFGILLGHVICREGMLMNPVNINIIVDIPPPSIVKQLRTTLGHTGYYRNFITGYAEITNPMKNLLNNNVKL